MKFEKNPKTVAEQIELLKTRGLRINNEKSARHELGNINYYRLSAYFLPFQKYNDPYHMFMPWATFEGVMNLYRFDRELRVIVLDAIERIEVALRCKIAYEYCTRYGANWYEDSCLYKRGYGIVMKKMREELARTKEAFIQHYYKKYTSPTHPPSWMAIEILSFGQLSMMFKNLNNNDAKKAIADYFGVGISVLESWIEHLAYVRNICAHHGRLWNRTLTVTPTIPKRPLYEWIRFPPGKPDKLYVSLCVMAYLLKIITPKDYFAGKLKTLVSRLPRTDLKAAGFNKNWEADPFWKSIHISSTYRFRILFFRCRYFYLSTGK